MILILACNYEAYIVLIPQTLPHGFRCVMALIRGLKGNYPGPICMIKREEQSDTTNIAPLRTSYGTREIVERGRKLKATNKI